MKGTVVTATVGVDYDWGPVLTGLGTVLQRSRRGLLEAPRSRCIPRNGTAGSWLVSAHPLRAGDGTGGSGAVGPGRLRVGRDDTRPRMPASTPAIRMMMAGLGVRGTLLAPAANQGFGMAVASDGLVLARERGVGGSAAGSGSGCDPWAVAGGRLVRSAAWRWQRADAGGGGGRALRRRSRGGGAGARSWEEACATTSRSGG